MSHGTLFFAESGAGEPGVVMRFAIGASVFSAAGVFRVVEPVGTRTGAGTNRHANEKVVEGALVGVVLLGYASVLALAAVLAVLSADSMLDGQVAV